MAKINISEFSIKVRLDSGVASRGLKTLQKNLKGLQTQINKTFADQNAKLNSFRQRANAINKMAKEQGKFNKQLNASNQGAIGLVKSFKTLKGLLAAGLGFYLVNRLVTNIYNTMKEIVSLGSKVQQAMLTLNAAIGASDVGVSLSPANLKKLQKQQRNFAENLATTYGLNVSNTLSNYAKFFAASSNYIGVQGSSGLFKALTQLGIVYGLSSEKMDRAMTAFTQMASKNQVMAEELKQQLGDVLPGSMEIFARAMTRMGKYGIVTVEKLYDMMAKGKIVASEVLPYVTEEMNRMSAGSLPEALKLVSVRLARVNSAWQIFSTGTLNQFNDVLGRLADKFAAMFHGKGFQTAFGQGIKRVLESLESMLDEVFNTLKEFEKAWASADLAGKHKLVDQFWTGTAWKAIKGFLSNMFNQVVALFVKAINALDKSHFTGFINTMVEVVTAIVKGVGGEIGGAIINKVSPYNMVSDEAKGKFLDFFEPRFRQNQQTGAIIQIGDVKTEVVSNDLVTAEQVAKDTNDSVINSFINLLPTALSTGGG